MPSELCIAFLELDPVTPDACHGERRTTGIACDSTGYSRIHLSMEMPSMMVIEAKG